MCLGDEQFESSDTGLATGEQNAVERLPSLKTEKETINTGDLEESSWNEDGQGT